MPDNENPPTVIIGGYCYRLNSDGRLERTSNLNLTPLSESDRGRARGWTAVTERTDDTQRAAGALMVLRGNAGLSAGPWAGLDSAFYLATGVVTTHEPRTAFQREVRADLLPSGLTFPEAIGYPDRATREQQYAFLDEVAKRRRESVKSAVLSSAAQHIHAMAGIDAREIAKAKGLKLWNGREPPSFINLDASAIGLRDNDSVHLFACAKSRLAVIRMVADLRGGNGIGVETRVAKYWHEGTWGNTMAGIEPEPGLWMKRKNGERPVRIWPKEKAE